MIIHIQILKRGYFTLSEKNVYHHATKMPNWVQVYPYCYSGFLFFWPYKQIHRQFKVITEKVQRMEVHMYGRKSVHYIIVYYLVEL